MVNIFRYVSDSLKDSFLKTKIKAEKSQNPELDMKALSYLAFDKMYFLRARDNMVYWYCYVSETYMDIAEYILRSNGLRPKRHYSCYDMAYPVVLRIPVKKIKKNPTGKDFIKKTMDLHQIDDERDIVFDYVQNLYEKLSQKNK